MGSMSSAEPSDQGTIQVALFVGLLQADVPRIQAVLSNGMAAIVAPSTKAAAALVALLGSTGGTTPSMTETEVVDDLLIDLRGHHVYWKGRELHLSRHELRFLAALARDPGRAWSFKELAEFVWGASYRGDKYAVRSAIQRLRGKFRVADVAVTIEAVPGVGYRLRESDLARRGREDDPIAVRTLSESNKPLNRFRLRT
jgi:DNA-binding response OmpR family regulator